MNNTLKFLAISTYLAIYCIGYSINAMESSVNIQSSINNEYTPSLYDRQLIPTIEKAEEAASKLITLLQSCDYENNDDLDKLKLLGDCLNQISYNRTFAVFYNIKYYLYEMGTIFTAYKNQLDSLEGLDNIYYFVSTFKELLNWPVIKTVTEKTMFNTLHTKLEMFRVKMQKLTESASEKNRIDENTKYQMNRISAFLNNFAEDLRCMYNNTNLKNLLQQYIALCNNIDKYGNSIPSDKKDEYSQLLQDIKRPLNLSYKEI